MKSVDKGKCVQAVALDFAKAFDKVSHRLLIQELVHYKISSQLIRWIHSFLCDRWQQVVVNSCVSESKNVSSGVPQGSVLGPSLFLLYVNDIVDVITVKLA